MEEVKRAPKPRRVECRLIEKESAREVTFSKRHQGLFRKAAELSVLCGAEVAVITYSPQNKPFAFAHPSTPDILVDRYLSGDVTRDTAAVEAAAHRKRYEDSVAKLEEAKRETERTAAEARKRKWWLDEAVEDSMEEEEEEEELEHYVASPEA